MKVILLKDLKKLGKEGGLAEVKDGYARNYLIPRGFALPATDSNFKNLDEIKKAKVKLAEKEKSKFLVDKEKIEKLSLTIAVEAKSDEELYGTVNESQILSGLEDEGVVLEKGQLSLDEPIKKLGVYSIKVKLHPEIEAALRVWVVKK